MAKVEGKEICMHAEQSCANEAEAAESTGVHFEMKP
jgi:hypothetical protein